MKLTNIQLISINDISIDFSSIPEVEENEVQAALQTGTLSEPVQVFYTGFDAKNLRYKYELAGNNHMMAIALAVRGKDPVMGETVPCVVVEEQHQNAWIENEPTPSVEIPHLAEEEEEEEEVSKELYEAMEETDRAKEELDREYEAIEILEQQRDRVKLDVSGLLEYLRIQLESDSYRKIQQALKAVRQIAPDAVQCKLNASKSALKEQAEAILA